MVEMVSAVLLTVRNLARSLTFYKDILGVPLVHAAHSGHETHCECEIGDVHFALFQCEDDKMMHSPGPIKIAFSVRSLKDVLDRCAQSGILPLYAPEDRGFAIMTALRDPDGNTIELTELSERWIRHLAGIRHTRKDAVAEFAVEKLSLADRSP